MGLQLRDELANSTREAIEALVDLWAVVKHYGPGPHPGTGTSQDVHGSGDGARAAVSAPVETEAFDVEREQRLRQWRFDNQDILDITMDVMERSSDVIEVEYPEGLKQYLSGTGLDARFLISHDGRIWSVGDHDAIAEAVERRFMTGDRFGNTATDVNPDVEEMRGYDELHTFHTASYNPKNELIAMGFVRGSIIDESRSDDLGINMQFTTPLEPAVRKTVKEFMEVYEGQNFLFDINFGEEQIVTVNERLARNFIYRFLEEKHYGPGPHPGTGTSQDVHGTGGGAAASVLVATPLNPARREYLHEVMGMWDVKEPLLEAWRERNPELIAQSVEILVDHDEAKEMASVWMKGEGEKVRFILTPDGRIFAVEDHDAISLDMRKKALTGKITGSTALAKLHPDDPKHSNPNKHIRDAWLELEEQFNPENIGGAVYPKIDMVNMGFVRGTIIYGEPDEYTELGLQLSTPVEPGARRTINDFLDVHEEDEIRYDVNVGLQRFAGSHIGTLKTIIKRSEEEIEERHYGPGAHPGTGTSQDVHGEESPGVFSWQDENIEHIPKKMGRSVPEGMDYRPGRWLGLHSEGMGDVFREFAKEHDYGGRISWSYIEEKLGRLEDDMDRERDNELIFEGELSSEDDARRQEMHRLWESFPGELSPQLEAAKHLNLRLLERDKMGVILAIRDVRSFKNWEPTLRHYGPGPHPGTGTDQDVHGSGGGPRAGKVQMTPTSRKQSGLGDFKIDRPAPSENNSIVFDDEELRAKGYSEEVIEEQREWFFANVSAAIIKTEDELDIEIHGMEVTNSIMDLAERQAGPLVMGHPKRREAFMGRLREDTDKWLGGYYKGVVWLDDNHQGELLSGPKDYDFRETVHHEVGHFLTASDGRAKFGADYVISMDDGTYAPSKPYFDTMKKFYGYDESVVDDEYRADLIASYPIYTESWIRIIPGSMNEHDKRNQEALVAALQEEAEFVVGPFTQKSEATEDEILVFFPKAGEIRGVPRSAINNLPKDAVILSEIFKN